MYLESLRDRSSNVRHIKQVSINVHQQACHLVSDQIVMRTVAEYSSNIKISRLNWQSNSANDQDEQIFVIFLMIKKMI